MVPEQQQEGLTAELALKVFSHFYFHGLCRCRERLLRPREVPHCPDTCFGCLGMSRSGKEVPHGVTGRDKGTARTGSLQTPSLAPYERHL